MIVNVTGHGAIKFPDTMSEEEVRGVLAQFEPKKDEGLEMAVKELVSVIKKKQPAVVTQQVPMTVEKQVVVTEPKVIEVERMVPSKPVSWHFEIIREDGLISEVYAEPIDGR